MGYESACDKWFVMRGDKQTWATLESRKPGSDGIPSRGTEEGIRTVETIQIEELGREEESDVKVD